MQGTIGVARALFCVGWRENWSWVSSTTPAPRAAFTVLAVTNKKKAPPEFGGAIDGKAGRSDQNL
jgi:hypothetical protein